MKFAFYTICPSPHQFPLAREIVARVGEANFRYVYLQELTNDRACLGWGFADGLPRWCVSARGEEGKSWLASAEVLLSGERDVALFERRAKAGLKTVYSAERWFKPPTGVLRLLHPRYLAMTWRFARLVRRGSVTCLPMGVWAARDLARVERLFRGDVRCLFRAPRLAFEPKPMGKIESFPWMRMWGYFVAAATRDENRPADARTQGCALRVLWVGRLLALKRVDTLFKAIRAALEKIPLELTIVGDGPERQRLEKFARELSERHLGAIAFHPPVPIAEVRGLMRAHDVYVLPSNAYEGWGAVVSEALEEGMEVFGTDAAGSSATILPRENLFAAGDWRTLARLLVRFARTGERHCHGIGKWTAGFAAEAFVNGMRGLSK